MPQNLQLQRNTHRHPITNNTKLKLVFVHFLLTFFFPLYEVESLRVSFVTVSVTSLCDIYEVADGKKNR